jgi:putative ABC transport system permease protein
MGLAFDSGADFATTGASARDVILSRSMAQRLFPSMTGIGEKVAIGGEERTVVGIVSDVQETARATGQSRQMYVPMQAPWQGRPPAFATLVTPWYQSPAVLRDLVLHEVRTLDTTVPVQTPKTFAEARQAAIADTRARAGLGLLAGGIGLLLAIVGIYGVLSVEVSARQKEIGVRLALGQTPRRVVAEFVRSSTGAVAAAIVIGVFGAVAIERGLQAYVSDFAALRPDAVALAVVLLLPMSAAASYFSVRKVFRIDPAACLRAE